MIKGMSYRNENGGFDVFVDDVLLSAKESQKIRNHSPDGFAWGYGGSGPAQLALAILLKFTDRKKAIGLYQAFKWDIISKLPRGSFELSIERVEEWINAHSHSKQKEL